jgi:hypothetical protein
MTETFSMFLSGISVPETNPVWIRFEFTMTSDSGVLFVGTMAECGREMRRLYPDVEFTETCDGGVITFTPSGVRRPVVLDAECPFFEIDNLD